MKITVSVMAEWSKYAKEFKYTVRDGKWQDDTEIKVCELEIEFETLSDIELRKAAYTLLLNKKSKIIADAMVRGKEIAEEAQELLALEDHSNKPEVL
jgi:hypothetical protein